MAYFTNDALKFLTELKKNNNKEWFDKNKARFEQSLRDPFVAFLADLEPRLKKLSPQFVVDARPNGGSLSRIYRDTRFAKDKSPYKTGLFAHFGHAKSESGPALYMHFEPKAVFVGGGIWQPDATSLTKIRAAIDKDGKGWAKATKGKTQGGCMMMGESLKRPPPGYDASHPHIEDLKRKDFALKIELDDKDVTGDKFLGEVVDGFKAVMPFMQFLSKAMGLPL
jgi:uncharacterized protein (TIGR02453 family)